MIFPIRYAATTFLHSRTMRTFLLLTFLSLQVTLSTLSAQTRDLAFYLGAAESSSPLLKDYANQLEAQRVDSLLIAAGFGPQVGTTGAWLYAPEGKGWGYDEAITNGGLYSALIGANVPLLYKAQREGRTRTIALQGQRVRTSAAVSLLDLKKSVSDQYVIAYGDQRALQFARAQWQLVSEEEQALQRLAASGIYKRTDVLAFHVNVQAKHIAMQRITNAWRNDLLLLGQLCGLTDTTSVQVEAPATTAPARLALDRSPVVRSFLLDSLTNLNSARLIDLNYRPQLSAFINGGLNAITPQTVPYKFGGSVGLNVTVPIYDGNQRRLRHDRIALQETTRQNYEQFYTGQLGQRYNQLTESLQRNNDLALALRAQSAEEERLIALYRIELEQGLVRLTDLFLILDAHVATSIALIQADTDRARTINELTYLK